MHDFIAIGDIVTDTFIKLKDAKVNCDINNEHCTITMRFGDKIPYESAEDVHAVGNSSNAAVACARLGLKSALVTHLGDDELGGACVASLRKDNVDTRYVDIQSGKASNHHYVLWYEADRTILVKHERYDYRLPDIDDPKWVYLSSLGENTERYHDEICRYITTHKNVNLAFQPGTFQMSLGVEKLKDVYASTNIFFSNIEEAERILGIDTLGTQELMKRMHALGPQIVVLTDGPKGAYAYDGVNFWFQPPYPDPKPPYERTGAGDAFASTIVAALAMGKDLPTALSMGAVNSMSVVQQVGAQKGLLGLSDIEKYLSSAPADFKTKKL